MNDVQTLFQRVHVTDYPDYAALDRVSDRPAVLICEQHMFRFIRIVVASGYLFSTLRFYLYIYPRTPFADRPLLYLHHYFFPSAGWSTPVGAAMGWCYGTYRESKQIAHTAVCAAAARERTEAVCACNAQQQQQQRRASQPSVLSFLSWLPTGVWQGWSLRGTSLWPLSCETGVKKDSAQQQQQPEWVRFLPTYGLLWVHYRSCVTGPCGDGQSSHMRELYSQACVCASCRSLDAARGTAVDSSISAMKPTQMQADWLVSRALRLRHSAETMRWHDTASRCAFLGVMTMLLAWNEGGLFFRASMGMGAGVVAGSVISALRLDQLAVRT